MICCGEGFWIRVLTEMEGKVRMHPMLEEKLEVSPTKNAREVKTKDGQILKVPDDWNLLLPGDAALSRRIKKDGPTWTMVEMKGRKKFSLGIWAPAERLGLLEEGLRKEREDPAYEKKLEAGRRRRAKEQAAYATEFESAVREFLSFSPLYVELEGKMAKVIAEHAVPVGSGTVARTKRISVERRAEAAVIAWMRHETTAYDGMVIPREKGARREVRRMLAKRSRSLLEVYRRGEEPDESCPLWEKLGE